MCTVAPAMSRLLRLPAPVSRFIAWPSGPLVLLAVVSVLSFGARTALLGQPCQSPCNRASEHTLIFDEAYYVNAARVIAGIRPPAGSHYDDSPLGTDPNAEHPQLAKLIIAGAIELFGDGPFAWRIGSLLFGSIAILGMYALVRGAGGGRWTALGAATLMACDNLLLVHGRIGTLDIYVVAMMIWGVAFYVRGSPLLAGVALAVAFAFKLVGPYVLASLLLLELIRVVLHRRDPSSPEHWRAGPAVRRFGLCTFTAWGVFFGLLAIMDQIATPYADASAQLITGGPFAHFWHMVQYASQQVSPNGPQGIASYPWDWLIDLKPITYLRINPSLPGDGLYAIHPVSKFIGMISPPILLAGLVGLVIGAWRLIRLPRLNGARRVRGDAQLPALGLSWFLGTWTPFAVLSLLDQRTSYLYYMVVVMPGLYVLAVWLLSRLWRRRRAWSSSLVLTWGVLVVVAVVLMYPFTPVF
jgi:4-amino-4-deoxy-L-arabinose transferase-like glycosyltransferase